MIITKEEKHLYAFLKEAFNIMGRSTSQKYLLGENGTLYFSTFYIKGSINIRMLKEKNGKMEEVDKNSFGNNFYSLKMLDDKSFELKEDLPKLFEDETAEDLRAITTTLFQNHTYVRELEDTRTTLLSTITKTTDIYVPDRFLGLIEKMGECELYVQNNMLLLKKEKNVEKEKITVKTSMLFVCQHDQPGGFNDVETRMQKM